MCDKTVGEKVDPVKAAEHALSGFESAESLTVHERIAMARAVEHWARLCRALAGEAE